MMGYNVKWIIGLTNKASWISTFYTQKTASINFWSEIFRFRGIAGKYKFKENWNQSWSIRRKFHRKNTKKYDMIRTKISKRSYVFLHWKTPKGRSKASFKTSKRPSVVTSHEIFRLIDIDWFQFFPISYFPTIALLLTFPDQKVMLDVFYI